MYQENRNLRIYNFFFSFTRIIEVEMRQTRRRVEKKLKMFHLNINEIDGKSRGNSEIV